MTSKQKIIFGSVAGVVAVFGIILFFFMGKHLVLGRYLTQLRIV